MGIFRPDTRRLGAGLAEAEPTPSGEGLSEQSSLGGSAVIGAVGVLVSLETLWILRIALGLRDPEERASSYLA